MAWWAWLATGWLLLAVVGGGLLAHRIGGADRRERVQRARRVADRRADADPIAARAN